MPSNFDFSKIRFNAEGLIPAIVQSASTNRVLMLAWMNRESLTATIENDRTVFFSRSRNELWFKGQTSGNIQKLISIDLDCDSDAVLLRVEESGPACHTGLESCFDSQHIHGSN